MAPIKSEPTDSTALVQGWFEAHREELVRYARRRVGASDADDVASEVLTRALAAVARYNSADPRPWLFGIAANVISEHRRAENRQWRAIGSLAAQTGRTAAKEWSEQQLHPRFVQALAELPTAQREALLLVVWGELSYEECAAALAVPVGTVRSRIARARAALQIVLGPVEETKK